MMPTRPKTKITYYMVHGGVVIVKVRNYDLYDDRDPARIVAWADWKERRLNA